MDSRFEEMFFLFKNMFLGGGIMDARNEILDCFSLLSDALDRELPSLSLSDSSKNLTAQIVEFSFKQKMNPRFM
jgi:hypothetical protein